MQKLQEHILKLREKPENVRRQVLVGLLTVCMVIVVGIWVLSLSSRFGNQDVAIKTREDMKPFKLFTSKIKNTYQGLSASAVNSQELPPSNEKNVSEEKMIDLIPIEQ